MALRKGSQKEAKRRRSHRPVEDACRTFALFEGQKARDLELTPEVIGDVPGGEVLAVSKGSLMAVDSAPVLTRLVPYPPQRAFAERVLGEAQL